MKSNLLQINIQRAKAIVAEAEKDRSWSAFNQGRWAFNVGIDRNDNPHLIGHTNHYNWTHGWDCEALIAGELDD